MSTEPTCDHETWDWQDRESDPLHPSDNDPTVFKRAICDDCDIDFTEMVGDYDPEIDGGLDE